MNNTVLIGRLVRDPELRYLPNSGTANATFTLAVDKGLSKDKKAEFEAQNKPTADFIRVVTWGKLAENVANYTTKGKLVGVQGRINTGSYEKEGIKTFTVDVVANQVEFLEFGEKKESFDAPDGFNDVDNDSIPF